MKSETIHVIISGLVQGVAFRHYTKLQADRIGVSGWVRNRRDGRVEALISGTRQQIDAMVSWLHSGSPAAVVDKVSVTEAVDADNCNSFDIRY